MIVSWVTEDEPGSSIVVYWSENSTHKKQAKGKYTTYRSRLKGNTLVGMHKLAQPYIYLFISA